jgi:hypothetical protein
VNREAEALEYAQHLGANFPFLRPVPLAARDFADRVAEELFGVDDEVPAERVAEGVALLDARERRRLVQTYVQHFDNIWEALCAEIGHDVAEEELVASAVRASIDERREPWPRMIEMLENAAVPALPQHAVACVLAHDDVWSLEDALTAAARGVGAEIVPEAWEALVADVASARLERVHLQRVRALARRLERFLPYEDFPRASDLLTRGCALVVRDRELARYVAVALLRNYVVHLVGPPMHRARN